MAGAEDGQVEAVGASKADSGLHVSLVLSKDDKVGEAVGDPVAEVEELVGCDEGGGLRVPGVVHQGTGLTLHTERVYGVRSIETHCFCRNNVTRKWYVL